MVDKVKQKKRKLRVCVAVDLIDTETEEMQLVRQANLSWKFNSLTIANAIFKTITDMISGIGFVLDMKEKEK